MMYSFRSRARWVNYRIVPQLYARNVLVPCVAINTTAVGQGKQHPYRTRTSIIDPIFSTAWYIQQPAVCTWLF